MKTAARGDRVYDRADPRHVGVVRQVNVRTDGTLTATIRWEETGWLSLRVPVRDLRRAAKEPAARTAMFNMKRALAARTMV